jgi:hypothetical protein
MSPNKLTDTQLVLLSAAAQREDGAVDPAEGPKGGLAKKAINKLLTDGLVEEVPAGSMLPVWRRNNDRGPLALCITPRGLPPSGSKRPARCRKRHLVQGKPRRMVIQLPMLHPKGRMPLTRQPRTDVRPPAASGAATRPGNSRQSPAHVFRSNPACSKCSSGDRAALLPPSSK